MYFPKDYVNTLNILADQLDKELEEYDAHITDDFIFFGGLDWL